MKLHKETPYKPTIELPADDESYLPELTKAQQQVSSLAFELYAKFGLIIFFGIMTIFVFITLLVFIIKSFAIWACLLIFIVLLFFIVGLLLIIGNLFPSTLPQYLEGILNSISKILSLFKQSKS